MSHNNKFSIAPPLGNDIYAEFYQLRKNASTMTVSTIGWFQNHLPILLDEVRYKTGSDTLAILSVGSGEGDIDIEIIKTILPHLNSPWKKLKYDALEPNVTHRNRFLERLSKNLFNENVSVSVHNTSFGMVDGFENNESYDLIIFVQVLYYFQVPSKIIQRAISQTNGRVVIVHQSAIGIPEIQHEHMLSLKGDENEILTTEDIKKLLRQENISYCYHNVNAYLDVTECFNQSEIGLKILSFCMECDLRKISKKQLIKVLQTMKDHIEDEGSVLYEPIGVFITNNSHLDVKKIVEDIDPVDDYRQLAQKFDWQKVFASINSNTIRLLDVACGTGRWIQAFMYYLEPQISQSGKVDIAYDLLDNSESALTQAIAKISSPLKLGNKYISPIQTIELENNCYDAIWSMHGFYAIPQQDLTLVIEKFLASLNETGSAFIAQATRDSFYVNFYTKYLEAFKDGKGTKFVAAEDITKALETLGIEYQVHVISYAEQIAEDDSVSVAHYILNEATINSFSDEDPSETASAPKNVQLKDLLANQDMKNYLQSFIKDSTYYFPEEIWLISFSKYEKLR